MAELSAQVVNSGRSCSEKERIDKIEGVVTELSARDDGSRALEKLEQSFLAQDLRLCTLEDSFVQAEGALNGIRDSQRAAEEAERRDLKRIKGIGVTLEKTLNEAGVESLDQVANLTIDQIEELSEKLGTFASRIERDQWVEQARALTA